MIHYWDYVIYNRSPDLCRHRCNNCGMYFKKEPTRYAKCYPRAYNEDAPMPERMKI